jgi:hypothetical protein
MFKKILIIAVLIMELLPIKQWLLCKQFKDFIHFPATNVELYTKGLINNDSGIPFFIIRFFHNKVVVSVDILLKNYFNFWDIRFATNMFSVIGYFGIILGVWYTLTRKFKMSKYLKGILVYILLIPFVEIMFEYHIDFVYKLIFIILPIQAFSFFGIWQFLNVNKGIFRTMVIVVLILISMWYGAILQPDIFDYCVKQVINPEELHYFW